jgi:hypothetical protein
MYETALFFDTPMLDTGEILLCYHLKLYYFCAIQPDNTSPSLRIMFAEFELIQSIDVLMTMQGTWLERGLG